MIWLALYLFLSFCLCCIILFIDLIEIRYYKKDFNFEEFALTMFVSFIPVINVMLFCTSINIFLKRLKFDEVVTKFIRSGVEK